MEFIIEIGTEEEQQLINQDLAIIRIFADQYDPPLAISQVIVPQDFQATVNKLLGTTEFRMVRGESSSKVEVMAKIVPQEETTVIVISPAIYFKETYDQMTRWFFYLHETLHVFNRQRFPQITKQPPSFALGTYMFILYHLYDEYFADREAYKMVEKLITPYTDYWKAYLQTEVGGCASVAMDKAYYRIAQSVIEAVLSNRDIIAFLENIQPIWDEMTTIMAHFYALYHHDQDLFKSVDFSESAFINEKTTALMEFYKKKFENNDIDISDGLPLVIEFMKNFGFFLEDCDGERHVQVYPI